MSGLMNIVKNFGRHDKIYKEKIANENVLLFLLMLKIELWTSCTNFFFFPLGGISHLGGISSSTLTI